MTITLITPGIRELGPVVDALRDWQFEGAEMQLHPGDLGWFWRFGETETAAAVRTWTRDGDIVAIGMLDGADVLRMTVAPAAMRDDELSARVARDLIDPASGVLPAGQASVEVPNGARLDEVLAAEGWADGERWTPLHRDLSEPVTSASPVPQLRIELVGPETAELRAELQRASFDRSTFSVERWRAMASGIPYSDARCLIAYDDDDVPVASATVWSAGAGKPGLLEPLGVHHDHRGRGYGTAICLAAASTLRELGSSSATVCTRSANRRAVATYRSAGFTAWAERLDRVRSA